MAPLTSFRNEALELIEKSLGIELDQRQRDEVGSAVDTAIVKSIEHVHESAVDQMLHYPLEDQDKAHKLADEMRRKRDALIANLSAQR